jgi:hypothetical protein
LPDTRKHRGPDPRDRLLFDDEALPRLRAAVADLSWLLSRGYAEVSSLKLVGDRHALTDRQRMAVRRSSCSDASLADRRARLVPAEGLRGGPLWIDGFNVLTTVEAALGRAPILCGRDGCYRDLAGVHGTFRKVEETGPAILAVGAFLSRNGVGPCRWLFDSPVSNSGRLKSALLERAREHGWEWQAEVVLNPDPVLATATAPVATADAGILDRAGPWANLARAVIAEAAPGAFLVDLGPEPPGTTVA